MRIEPALLGPSEQMIPIQEVRLKPSDVWKPNIIVYNSDDGDFKSYIQGNIYSKSTPGGQIGRLEVI